jgi:hypothetical protein
MQNDVNCIETLENEQTQFLKRRFSSTNAYACCWRAVSSMSNVSESNLSDTSGSCRHVSHRVIAYERLPSVTDEQMEARDDSQS